MKSHCAPVLFAAIAVVSATGGTWAGESIVQVGAGSYSTVLPKGAKGPPATIYKTDAVTGPIPTNDWWSSLAWLPYSERHYPHPLAIQAGKKGLRVHYPGAKITANKDAIFGFMPPENTDEDFVIGHSAQAEFPDARLDGWSDWFVRASFAAGGSSLKVSYGHGSPFVYALYEGGTPKLIFGKPPTVWAGTEKDAVLGVSVSGRHYGLFGPSGSTWSGLGGKTFVCNAGDKRYFSAAVLPENTEKALKLFQQYAYAHVTDTKVAWEYEPQTGTVTTKYAFTVKAYEGAETGTLTALYPHQWRNTPALLLDYAYASVRGTMKLAQGTTFSTQMKFHGVLPALPDAGGCDRARLAAYVKADAARPTPSTKDTDTYGEGKLLGRLAALAPIAEQCGLEDVAASVRKKVRERLEQWFTAAGAGGQLKAAALFYYNDTWGALIGYRPGFGSDTELNDHHFHYGYFVKAAAEIARSDPAWAAADKWGGMVKLLGDDIACTTRDDKRFPFLRNFDPYAGHSWASGHAKFGDGNNNESSSEAMNAWCGLILWGEATGDKAVRDLGIYLYTTELAAIQEYWFDVHHENFPKSYTPSVVTMVWGGKGANGTWFSAKPELVHGINWLPIHGGSLYLGLYPDYVKYNYDALAREAKGAQWTDWADIIWMYLALADPQEALAQFEAREKDYPAEGGNSKANTYQWLSQLKALGQVEREVTADYPLYAVFRKDGQRTHAAWNFGKQPRTVTFSDGFKLDVKAGECALTKGGAK